MEMPTPCKRCNTVFELHDGGPSADGKYQICKKCSENEALESRIDELQEKIEDELIAFNECQNLMDQHSSEIVELYEEKRKLKKQIED